MWDEDDMFIIVAFVGCWQKCGKDSIGDNAEVEVTHVKILCT
jgi:hypothetical protein